MDKFRTHLFVLYYQGLCEIWSDVEIQVGEEWEQVLIDKINISKLAVLLISPDFLASEFINTKEIPLLLKRKNDGLQIIPIMLRPCSWKHVPWLSELQIRPSPNEPLSQWENNKIDEELAKIVDEIGDLLKNIGIRIDNVIHNKIIRESYFPAPHPREEIRTKASKTLFDELK
jgi:TIR domain